MMRPPARMMSLRRDDDDLPVPWHAAWRDGVPDLAAIEPGRLERALAGRRCWQCGWRLDDSAAFICEPVQAALRIAVSPPSHPDCASYVAGMGSRSAPGVTVVVVTREWQPMSHRRPLFRFGEPERVEWWRFGRDASRAEALAALGSVAIVMPRRRGEREARELARICRWLPTPSEREIVA